MPGKLAVVSQHLFEQLFAQRLCAGQLAGEQLIDAGGGVVVALMTQRALLPGGDSWMELEFGVVYRVEDGLLMRGDVYIPGQAALEAAGLGE